MNLKTLSQEDKEKYLGAVEYPAGKEAVVSAARENEAPQDLLDKLDELPGDDEFSGPQDVLAVLQGLPRVRTSK